MGKLCLILFCNAVDRNLCHLYIFVPPIAAGSQRLKPHFLINSTSHTKIGVRIFQQIPHHDQTIITVQDLTVQDRFFVGDLHPDRLHGLCRTDLKNRLLPILKIGRTSV